MTDSEQLLGEYMRNKSESAFREIVSRYLNLVYSSALRLVDGDTHRAEDVAQIVFSALAKKAGELPPNVMLGGWLHRHTCFVAANTMRGERRRLYREREAVEMSLLHNDSETDFNQLAPLLDESINQLEEADRTAIVLRFFEQRDYRTIGGQLESSEEAARKRVSRAVDKLRDLLAQRGIRTTSGALSAVVAINSVQAAPMGMAGRISAAALVGTATKTTTSLITASKIIAMTTFQKIVVTAALAAALGAVIYQAKQAHAAQAEAQKLQAQQAPLIAQIKQLQGKVAEATNRFADLMAENTRLKSNPNQHELLKLRGDNTKLQNDSSELGQVRANQKELREKMMADAKKNQLRQANIKTQLLSQALSLDSTQTDRIRGILSGDAEAKFQVTTDVLTGNVQQDEIARKLAEIRANEEAGIEALLTPDQLAAYKNWENEQNERTTKAFAEREVQSMGAYLDLSTTQSEAATAALESLPPSKDDGGTLAIESGQVEAELQARVQALAQVLTPDQLQTYQQNEMKQIEAKKSTIENFKVVFKTTM